MTETMLEQLRPSLHALHIQCDPTHEQSHHETVRHSVAELGEVYDVSSHYTSLASNTVIPHADSMAAGPAENHLGQVVAIQDLITKHPYDISLRLALSQQYAALNYPDLAAGEAYKALLLVDEVADESGEYHELALEALREGLRHQNHVREAGEGIDADPDQTAVEWASTIFSQASYEALIGGLFKTGCHKSATERCLRMLRKHPTRLRYNPARQVLTDFCRWCAEVGVPVDLQKEVENLPEVGWARRELYPWNDHEPDRFSEDALRLLNEWMTEIAPKLEVRATNLPNLGQTARKDSEVQQLGVFAKQDLRPGEVVLDELSLLTASARLNDTFCDACSRQLTTSDGPENSTVACDECEEAVFCSQECFDLAQASYHPATCDRGVSALSRDVPPREAADALYSLLLSRGLAMAETQDAHPLDLKEVRYIWGDYTNSDSFQPGQFTPTATNGTAPKTLPFSFMYNILMPLNMLEKMNVNIFDNDGRYDTWVFNTLYAKFRGTASAKQGLDGRPEVGAVHPLWCLANHSCDPGVTWSWEGRIALRVKERREQWLGRPEGEEDPAGIAQGQEVLNHYCDVTLPVKERREWAVGALGGFCQCSRCRWEDRVRM